MKAPPIETEVGIETFSTQVPGIGGKLRAKLEDFIVEEITSQGEILKSYTFDQKNPDHDLKFDNIRKKPYTIRLVLEKYNVETFLAATRLAAFLHIPYRNIGYAGLKDRRAITVQQISISGGDPSLLTQFHDRGIFLNRLEVGKPIKLGMLNGNHFKIQIRQIDQSYELVKNRLEQIQSQIKSFGVPNFYGPQRFGVIRPITHRIGKSLLQKDFESALKIYLTATFPQEDEEIRQIRVSIGESWPPQADRIFPRKNHYENKIIRYFRESMNFKSIFKKVFPFRYFLLFIHAYQSYLFNRMLSHRIQKKLLPINQAVEGDFVALLDSHSLPTRVIYEVTSSNLQRLNSAISKGKAIVMFPLFSYNMNYTRHPLGDFIESLISEEELDLSLFRSTKNKRLNFRVVYRPISLAVHNLSLSVKEESPASGAPIVKATFSVNKGCYATVFLRELMKTSPLNY